VYIIPMTDEAAAKAFDISHRLRSHGYSVEQEFGGGSLKSRMRKANRSGARFAVIIGENELAKGEVIVKQMDTSEQTSVPVGRIIDALDERLSQL